MKRYQYLVALSIPLIGSSALAFHSAGDGDHAYLYFKERVSLALDAGRIALHHGGDAAAALRAIGGDALGWDAANLAAGPIAEWSFITLPADAVGEEGVSRFVGRLAAQAVHAEHHDEALFVSPVFLDEYGPVLITRDVLIGFAEDVSADEARAILGGVIAGEIMAEHFARMPNVYYVRFASRNGFEVLAAANALALHPHVLFAEPDMLRTGRVAGDVPNDPMFHQLWHLHNTGQNIFDGINEACCPCTGSCFPPCPDLCVPTLGTPCQQMPGGVPGFDMNALEAWTITTGDPSIIVAIFDSGVNMNHPDLVIDPALGKDFTGQGGGGAPVNNTCNPHGTRVAGLIGATMNNSIGVTGLAPDCRVASARIATQPCQGAWSTTSAWIINGLSWAEEIGARITNHSYMFGGSAALTTKLAQTRLAGMIHFGAAGNGNGSPVGYPASLPTVNGVSALDLWKDPPLASYSNFGSGLAFSAPGNVIVLDAPGGPYSGDVCNDYTYSFGTSFASPLAAGVAALVLSVDPSLSVEEVEQIMRDTAVDLGPAGYDIEYGWGFVNAGAAVKLALPTTCIGDLTGSGSVGVPDLLQLLGCWGSVAPGSACEAADLTGSGSVGVPDLLALLSGWGVCP